MVVTFKFLGSLRKTFGKSKITLGIEKPVRLREAIVKMIEHVPTSDKKLIDHELANLGLNNLVLVNGREISVLNGLETMLKDEDEVVFVPVSHGG